MSSLKELLLPSWLLDNLLPVRDKLDTGLLDGIQGGRGLAINYLDLFSGTGGFAKGLLQAGFRFKKHFFSEIDKHASANYQYQFPKAAAVGDITRISTASIERPDIITFGSPCQDISIAGKRRGLKGSRSRLFFEAIRLIRECKPRVFVFENVKGLFSSNQGKDFEAVLQAFADIGFYGIQWQLLNTRWFLPQNRERLYFVGLIGKKGSCPVLPIGQSNPQTDKGHKKNMSGQVSPTITTTVGELTNHAPYVLHVPENTIKGYTSAYEGDAVNLAYLKSNTKRGRVGKGFAHTIDTAPKQFTILKGRLRRLTPRDCERLQGFPDEWTRYGLYDGEKKEITDGHRYEMLGNAVTVPVVKAIGKKLRRLFKGKRDQALNGIDALINGLLTMKGSSQAKKIRATSDADKNASGQRFAAAVQQALIAKQKHNKTSLEKLAASFGITDKTAVKELIELAIVRRARELAHRPGSIKERYHAIVELYNSQVNLSHRTSQSMLLQQYSTPAPIGYIAGVFCELDRLQIIGDFAFEPSAGNGLLTVAAQPERVFVNEIDNTRNRNLHTQGYAEVTKVDATIPFKFKRKRFVAVITNPPFGTLNEPVFYGDFKITMLEHLMALRALDTMSDKGKAAIIIGGHTRWDELGRIQAGRNRIFFNYLYRHYHVADVINIDGKKLYSRQGTAFDVRLILIDGRKAEPSGAAPLYDAAHDKVVDTFDELYERVMDAMNVALTTSSESPNEFTMRKMELEAEALMLELELLAIDGLNGKAVIPILTVEKFMIGHRTYSHKKQGEKEWYRVDNGKSYISTHITRAAFLKARKKHETLGAPYQPASQACVVLDTQVPDSMSFETQSAIDRIRQEVGGDMDNFVRHRLGYLTKSALCRALSAEQIDAVGVAIYNIEARGQGMIIGDQTGIGKGRVAASIIRYATEQGLKPVFLTEKANLFSDIYRDLSAIGSGHLRPFIVNARESKTDIKDEDGNIVYQAAPLHEQQDIFQSRSLPASYDFVVATYSQFNSPDKKPEKPGFLVEIAQGNIFVLDEAHNSSGSSNTGSFLQGVVAGTSGVVFLSATFAKRPDNMPIYAMKTAIADCTMSRDELVESITRGGVALQEVLSAQLVAEGQMLRRERSFEGVEVNYITLDDLAVEHRAIADNITIILRDIIDFQNTYINGVVKDMDKIAAAEGKETEVRKGTSQAGVDNTPYFSKIFQVINQMLFSLKAEAVAQQAIRRRKEGKKPVIAFASTMGSFIETLEDENGMPVTDGSTINADFAEVLKRGLDGVMRYTEKDVSGKPEYKQFSLDELAPEASVEYLRIAENIRQISTGITISPIDVIVQILKEAGYTVAEVTGRKFEVQLNRQTGMGLVLSRKKLNTNDAFRKFNNNEVDVLMINQSGSTGASAHAIPTAKVPKEQVQQRVMIVLQAELDINTEVQKRGRINRTGQILKPIYDYVTSAIPAEMRLMMMLQKKLKSLDANTTSNQKQSTKILDVPDFLNKYGDKIVVEYLMENPEVNRLLDDPLHLDDSESDGGGSLVPEDAAHRVSGRVAVLSTHMQQEFYNEIAARYQDYVEYLLQVGEYDLEVEAMNLEAETVRSRVVKMGKGTDSAFGEDSTLETVMANVLKKPFSREQLDNMLTDAVQGKDPSAYMNELLSGYELFTENKLSNELQEESARYDQLIEGIPSEKHILKLATGSPEWQQAIAERKKELDDARNKKLEMLKTKAANNKHYLLKIFNFFHPARFLNYPVETYTGGHEQVPAVFIGYSIDLKKKNPYVPSLVKLRFAVASSSKYLVLPASLSTEVMSIIGASANLEQPQRSTLLDEWETYTKENNVDRKTRHIITGNLLQAFSDFKGKLVSYTTTDGQVKKGILLPENWDPGEQVADNVTVPIAKALPLIRSLVQGHHIVTNNSLSIFRAGDYFKIIVAASRVRGGDIYLDKELLEQVVNNNFEKTSDKMVAHVAEGNIGAFVNVLQKNHGASITISSAQFKQIEKQEQRSTTRRHIELPPPAPKEIPLPETVTTVKPVTAKVLSMLELEAEALVLELELLAA